LFQSNEFTIAIDKAVALSAFKTNITIYNSNCVNLQTTLNLSQNVTITQTGCIPTFQWTSATYSLVLN